MDKEISLKELLQSFWHAKIYMLAGFVLACAVTLVYLSVVMPKYKAEMIVAPADGYALGDYASSVEYDRVVSLPFWRPKDSQGVSTDFYRFMHTLRGPAVAAVLVKDESVLKGINKTRQKKITTPAQLAKYLDKNIRINPLGATPLRKLNYSHPEAEFASALLRKLHLVTDQMIRRDRRRQSQSRIEYLEKALRRTTNPDHRKGITNLLLQQEHVQMLANLDEAYAAIIVEPASSSPRPTWPNRPFIFGVAAILGLMFGYITWLLRRPEGVRL